MEVRFGGFGECVGEVGLVGHKGRLRRIEKFLRQAGQLGDGLAFRIDGRRAADGDDFAAGGDKGCNLLQCFQRNAIGRRNHEDRVSAKADFIDGIGVDVVDVITGG